MGCLLRPLLALDRQIQSSVPLTAWIWRSRLSEHAKCNYPAIPPCAPVERQRIAVRWEEGEGHTTQFGPLATDTDHHDSGLLRRGLVVSVPTILLAGSVY